MDGVLFDSMPNHAKAWEIVANSYRLRFTAKDCYLQEGRTGYDVISQTLRERDHGKPVDDNEVDAIYQAKTEQFIALGGAKPMPGMKEVLHYLQSIADTQLWVVTGSGQDSLFQQLDTAYPRVFTPERMITAYDVRIGKPNPAPYLKAWERSRLSKEECCVIENAPLGCRAGKAAGLFTIIVNTGPLGYEHFKDEKPDIYLKDMYELLHYFQQTTK